MASVEIIADNNEERHQVTVEGTDHLAAYEAAIRGMDALLGIMRTVPSNTTYLDLRYRTPNEAQDAAYILSLKKSISEMAEQLVAMKQKCDEAEALVESQKKLIKQNKSDLAEFAEVVRDIPSMYVKPGAHDAYKLASYIDTLRMQIAELQAKARTVEK